MKMKMRCPFCGRKLEQSKTTPSLYGCRECLEIASKALWKNLKDAHETADVYEKALRQIAYSGYTTDPWQRCLEDIVIARRALELGIVEGPLK